MHFSADTLRQIVAQASTLAERYAGIVVPSGGDEQASRRRLARWREVVSLGGSGRFDDHLRQQGLDGASEDQLAALVGPVHLPAGTELPAWALLLEEITGAIAGAFTHVGSNGSGEIPADKPGHCLPYAPLYWPIANLARTQVTKANPSSSRLTTAAWRGLQSHLLQRISGIVASALHTSFLVHKSVNASGMSNHVFGVRLQGDAPSNRQPLYTSFVVAQGQDGLRSFFERYPVAGRLVAEVTLFWIELAGEFIQRLADDEREIACVFNEGDPLKQLVSIKTGVSDPHNRGRFVLLLGFAGGMRLVYKPRSLVVDQAFYGLAQALNSAAGSPGLRILKVLTRSDYGWIEFARHAPCADREAAQRFYKRAGALLCVAHWLHGIDFHRENIVAAGEHPVLIDLESLCHPSSPGEWQPSHSIGRRKADFSIFRTGLLPLWKQRPFEPGWYHNSGLGAPVSLRSLEPHARWRHLNSDRMTMETAKGIRIHREHRSTLGGRLLVAEHFATEITAGYRSTAAVLQGVHRDRFDGLRDLIQRSPRRHIKKPTFLYWRLLRRTATARHLTHGVERSIELQALASSAPSDTLDLELQAMEHLDVPYFECMEASEVSQPPLRDQLNAVRLALRTKTRVSGNEITFVTPRRSRRPSGT